MNNHLGTFFIVQDHPAFMRALQEAINAGTPHGIYTGDNLFTFGRNLGFLSDPSFAGAVENNVTDEVERSIVWRLHTLCWAAFTCMSKQGDYVECGTYQGFGMSVVCEYLNFGEQEKKMYLYDLFEHDETMPHHAMPKHGPDLFGRVKERFSKYPNVTVSQGRVPEVFETLVPDKIAFLHIDMNNAEAEIGALNGLWERVVDGGIVIFDDYGWSAYESQQQAEDKWMAEHGYRILELPTGQGLVVK